MFEQVGRIHATGLVRPIALMACHCHLGVTVGSVVAFPNIKLWGALLGRCLVRSALLDGCATLAAQANANLSSGSPVHLLARGWSVTRLDGHDAALKSTAGIAAGATIITQLADGRLWSRVERTTNDAIGR